MKKITTTNTYVATSFLKIGYELGFLRTQHLGIQEEDNHYMCLYVLHIFSLSYHAFEWSGRGGKGEEGGYSY